ncbi:MlaD family protein [Nocardia jejuensis]|uniref:MlaD family protein n=1 Tax=Nocardia jejuensis TaxID=328049 RepID=UPI00082C696B|nr:MlaD family protein [Nocardia jejuensis]
MKLNSLFSLAGIAAISVLGIAYLTFGVVRVEPFRDDLTATLILPNSAGLEVGSRVLLTGVQVGQVSEINRGRARVEVRFTVRDPYRVPIDSEVTVESLSALGEPYIEFAPTTDDDGPYLRRGQVLEGSKVRAPLSIPQVARLVTQGMNQLDPGTMRGLVDTAGTALRGTDAVIPGLARGTDLLAAALLSRSPEFGRLLTDLQTIAPDMDWAAPSFDRATPTFVEFGQRVDQIAQSVERLVRTGDTPAMYQQGNGLVPFLDRLTERLDALGPELAPLLPALRPLAASAAESIPPVDLSALISAALRSTDPAGALHLRVNLK